MIYITRHGQTEWNALKKVMGKIDIPLSETGLEQAKQTKDNLKGKNIDLIICSPLIRAKQTADIINEEFGIPIVYDNRIVERDFGEMEGLSISEFDFEEFWDYHKNVKYKTAENIQGFFNRVYIALEDYLVKYKDKDILIVTHGGVAIATSCFFRKNIPHDTLLKSIPVINNCEVVAYE